MASKSKREALSNGAIARLLKKGSGLDRVSQKAVDEARKLLTKKIAHVGEMAKERLAVAKRTTLKDDAKHDDVRHIAEKAFKCTSVRKPRDAKNDVRDLTEAGVLRVLGKTLPHGSGKAHISEGSKKELLDFAENFLYVLGHYAGSYATNAKRSGLSLSDVEAARDALMSMK